jgi:hypothetical protein
MPSREGIEWSLYCPRKGLVQLVRIFLRAANVTVGYRSDETEEVGQE